MSRGPTSRTTASEPSSSGIPASANSKNPKPSPVSSWAYPETTTFTGVPVSVSIDPACNIDGSISCTGMDFYLNFNGNGDTRDFGCALTSGTIVLTDVSSSRAKGTFSGTGDCIPG